MKKILCLIMSLLLCFTALTACSNNYEADYSNNDSSYESESDDSDYNLGNYDYDDDGEVDDNEFQDAVNDYMDDNGY